MVQNPKLWEMIPRISEIIYMYPLVKTTYVLSANPG